MGNLLRRYWHPIATVPDLDAEPVLAVTILGESLALFRSDDGSLGLVAQRCPHRGASLAYGIPENDGLRCPYHGWKFGMTGTCLEQPAEPDDSTFKDRIRIPAYPVQEMGGLIWAYLGPEPRRCCHATTSSYATTWYVRLALLGCRVTGCRSWRTRWTRSTSSTSTAST